MTGFDATAVILLAGYALLGLRTGLIRRVLGLVAIYIALLVATFAGTNAAAVMRQQWPQLAVSDSRAYAWFGIFVFMVLLIEVLASFVHNEIQISVIPVNRASGLVIGLLSAVVVITSWAYMLGGLGEVAGSNFGPLEVQARAAVSGSKLGLPIAAHTAGAVLPPLYAALPRDPERFYTAASG